MTDLMDPVHQPMDVGGAKDRYVVVQSDRQRIQAVSHALLNADGGPDLTVGEHAVGVEVDHEDGAAVIQIEEFRRPFIGSRIGQNAGDEGDCCDCPRQRCSGDHRLPTKTKLNPRAGDRSPRNARQSGDVHAQLGIR